MMMIKRAFFCCLFFALLMISVDAQEFNGGLVGGITASQIDGDSQSGYNKAGAIAGAFVRRPFAGNFAGLLEMRFMQNGMYSKQTGTRLTFSYIEVPLLAQYEYSDLNLLFEMGTALGTLIKVKGDVYDSFEHELDGYNTFSAMVCAGIQYSLTEKLKLAARGGYSILPINTIKNSYQTRSQHHNQLMFCLYYTVLD